ncbi:MAG: glycosyltransferase family 2 protein [Puniceicoccales bacterium]|jgi:glycosyltransferase involved in cell wall biosynthesis|nr:glycosyltransferase family 2 protein [Puniceicoccales bacterium]
MNVSQNKLPLSIVIIAKDAERCIARCLESVYRWSQEIVVVINECTDCTAAIAVSFGAQVINHPWQGFKEQRNFAKQLASMPWILSLDADEAVSKELKQSIMDFIVRNDTHYNGASCARLTYFLGKSVLHGGLFPDINVRLFRKNCGHWEGDSTHERLHIDGEVFLLKGNLIHYSHGSLKEQIERLLIYSEFLVKNHKGQQISSWRICIQTFTCFFRRYVLKAGFLDGFRGLYLALAASFFQLYEYTRLYEDNVLHCFPEGNLENVEVSELKSC